MKNKKNKAVFLDRDGTINRDINYCRRIEDFEFLPDVPEAIKLLNDNGFKVIVITNQSGIARGFYTETELSKIHDYMKKELAKHGAIINGIYYCPHHPDDNCDCRKPLPKLILQAVKDHDIQLNRSYFIGDKPSDILTGNNAKCKTVLLNCDLKPNNYTHSVIPDNVTSTLLEAVRWIIQSSICKS
jgi:D,D-heptose 1,7-bisphosphate phosphatase